MSPLAFKRCEAEKARAIARTVPDHSHAHKQPYANLERRGLLYVAEEVARVHNLSVEAILGRSRFASVTRARRDLYVALRNKALSFPEIGALLERDSTTILAAVHQANRETPGVVKISDARRVRVAV